jgi:hypothetical protein
MQDIVCASSPLPLDYPFRVYRRVDTSPMALLEQMKRMDDFCDTIIKKYDLESWVAVNQVVHFSLSDWLGRDWWRERFGLDTYLKQAIARVVDKVVKQRENVALENQRKLDQMIQANKRLVFPADTGSTVSRYLQ